MSQMEIIFILFTFLLVFVYLIIIKRLKKTQFTVDDLLEKNTTHQEQLKLFNQQQKNPLGNLLNGVKEGITIHFDKTGKILYTDKNFQNLLGYNEKELLKKNLKDLLGEKISPKDPMETEIIQRIFSYPKLYPEFETELETKSGKKIWISWTTRILNNKKNIPIEVWAVGFDISKRKNLESELQFMASVDHETGLLNRQAFLKEGTRELRRTIRYHHDLSLLILQLIYQGQENLPLMEREKFLKAIAEQCKKTVRDVDYLGRIGEVDLALLLPETNIKNIPFLEKRLMENITKEENKLNYPISIRYGMSGYKKETSIDELIMNAYNKMNQTKGKKECNSS